MFASQHDLLLATVLLLLQAASRWRWRLLHQCDQALAGNRNASRRTFRQAAYRGMMRSPPVLILQPDGGSAADCRPKQKSLTRCGATWCLGWARPAPPLSSIRLLVDTLERGRSDRNCSELSAAGEKTRQRPVSAVGPACLFWCWRAALSALKRLAFRPYIGYPILGGC
jgi:hypothetical protein